jgi:hypothetical protein
LLEAEPFTIREPEMSSKVVVVHSSAVLRVVLPNQTGFP